MEEDTYYVWRNPLFARQSCIYNEGNPLFARESKGNPPTGLIFAEALLLMKEAVKFAGD